MMLSGVPADLETWCRPNEADAFTAVRGTGGASSTIDLDIGLSNVTPAQVP